jgi:hypothetical protein
MKVSTQYGLVQDVCTLYAQNDRITKTVRESAGFSSETTERSVCVCVCVCMYAYMLCMCVCMDVCHSGQQN